DRFDEEVGNRVKVKENEWATERKTHVGEINTLREKVKSLETQLASIIKEKDEAVTRRDELTKEVEALSLKVDDLTLDVGAQFDEGFQFALEQV
ncbi:hypothetical protein A2U01_0076741, partial [Trifolium medium]|nr:hypothetical protein [Trifolium medium]